MLRWHSYISDSAIGEEYVSDPSPMITILSLILGASLALAAVGPISTDAPNPAGGSVANDAPPLSTFFAGHNPPYPTDDWWVGYGAGSGDA